MNLLLIRHGDAESIGSDAKRPLSPLGKQQIENLSAALKIIDLSPQLILTSPLIRARQTAQILQQKLSPTVEVQSCELLAPGSPKHQLIQYITALHPKENIFLVGHLPLLGELLSLLTWGSPEREIPLSKGGASLIEFQGPPRTSAGNLLWLLPNNIIKIIAASKT